MAPGLLTRADTAVSTAAPPPHGWARASSTTVVAGSLVALVVAGGSRFGPPTSSSLVVALAAAAAWHVLRTPSGGRRGGAPAATGLGLVALAVLAAHPGLGLGTAAPPASASTSAAAAPLELARLAAAGLSLVAAARLVAARAAAPGRRLEVAVDAATALAVLALVVWGPAASAVADGATPPATRALAATATATTALAAALAVAAALCRPGGTRGPVGPARIGLWASALVGAPALGLLTHLRGGTVDHALLLGVAALTAGAVLLRVVALARSGELDRARLADREAYYRALAQHSSDLVVVLDGTGRVLDVSSSVVAVLGRAPEDLVGRDAGAVIDLDDLDGARRLLARAVERPGRTVTGELRVTRADGRGLWLEARLVSLEADPVVGGVVVHLHDVTDRKRAEGELAHQAFHDRLTGLANRALLHDRLDHALQARSTERRALAVVYIDLDRFKLVNDSLGHQAGDQLLRAVSARLLATVRAGDTVARLGGDEFAVLVEGPLAHRDELAELARRILARLGEPLEVAGTTVLVGASVGIALADGGTLASRDLLRRADLAMYAAKGGGRERYEFFRPAMEAAALERLQLEADLRTAVTGGQFELEFQPLVRLGRGDLVGFEALLRWAHPGRGVLQPDAFLPIAEESGQVEAIGRWVLDEACATAATWQARAGRGPGVFVSVNVSAGQFRSPTLVDDVRAALSWSGLAPRLLLLELAESVLLQDEAFVAGQLGELRALGVRVGVDDVGSSRSLLGALHRNPVDVLKLDRSLMRPQAGAEVPPVVRGLLELGRTLDVDTVAQGVETDLQASRLRAAGCEVGQGFFLAHPLKAAAATRLALRQAPTVEGGCEAVA